MKSFRPVFVVAIALIAVIGIAGTSFGQDTKSIIVTETGNVGIGATNPQKKLEVAGDTKINGDAQITGDVVAQGRVKDKTGFIMPVGTILPFGGTTTPEGWLLCDGSAVNRAGDYADLFAVVGTSFGSPDANTFNIPDLRGQFLRGVDSGSGNDPDAAARSASNTGGNTGDNVGSKQDDMFKSHYHVIRHRKDSNNGNGMIKSTGSTSYTGTDNSLSSGGNETRPKNISVNYIIKY